MLNFWLTYNYFSQNETINYIYKSWKKASGNYFIIVSNCKTIVKAVIILFMVNSVKM
jgi:hypothetical protein